MVNKVISSSGLPVVSAGLRQSLDTVQQEQGENWSKLMLRQLKEENPEINSLLLDLAHDSQDPKAVVLAGYKVYKLLELAEANERRLWRE